MAIDIYSEEGRVVRQLIPLATLPFNRFKAVCEHLSIEEIEGGQFLFRRGDAETDLIFLLKGSVTLQTEALKIETIKADSDSARFALAHQIPRKVDAVANGRIRFLRLKADMMKSAQDLPYEENESYMIVDESADNDDWMTTLLKSPIFRGLPPANLQKILMGMQEVAFSAGEVIIEQGTEGDFYYIIKKGQCLISRKPSPNSKDIKLGQLVDQDTFGEDALISGEPRNVSITALTDVTLLRLGKEPFNTLIKQPALKYIDYAEAQDLVAKGADLIDVREPDEYKKSHLANSINVPFFSLRMQLKTLNRHNPIVVVCRNGKVSETAAFVLLRHKFNALILRGGMAGVSPELLSVPATFTIDEGVETANLSSEVVVEAVSSQPQSSASDIPDETVRLKKMVQQLKAHCSMLETQKKILEQKCGVLTKQVDALRVELGTLKNR